MYIASPKAKFSGLNRIRSADLLALLELLEHQAFAGQSEGLRAFWEALCGIARVELSRRDAGLPAERERILDLPQLSDLTLIELLALENLFFRLAREQPLSAHFFKPCYLAVVDTRIRGECQIRELERIL